MELYSINISGKITNFIIKNKKMLKFENNSNKKFIFLFTILIAIINFFKCSDDEVKIGKISIKDGMYLASEFTILATNKNNMRVDGKTKICSISSRLDYENYCKPFLKIYYDKWVYLYFI